MLVAVTPHERLMAALEGRETDHVPVWLLFPYNRVGYYVDVREHPAYRPVFEASRRQAITLNRRNLGVSLHAPDVVTRREQDGDVVRDIVTYRDVRLTRESAPGRAKKLLDTDDDLEAWMQFPLNLDEASIRAQLSAHLPRYREEQRAFPADLGAMMLDLGEPINPLYHAANLESYSIWSLTHADAVKAWLDGAMAQRRIIYRWCLEHQLAEVYFMVGSELASPPLVSRATFQQWVVPYARELIAMIHDQGAKVIQHYHGQIREILDDFVTMGPDGLHTIEAPPIGNCTFTQAYAAVGNRITLIGNIQYDDFRALDGAGMAQAVRDVLAECRGRRLILSPSAGPFDENPPPRLIENYLTFMETAWNWAG